MTSKLHGGRRTKLKPHGDHAVEGKPYGSRADKAPPHGDCADGALPYGDCAEFTGIALLACHFLQIQQKRAIYANTFENRDITEKKFKRMRRCGQSK